MAAHTPASDSAHHNSARERRKFYICSSVACLVYAVTPLSWLTVALRWHSKGSPFNLPLGFVAKFWYIQSLCEVVFSIYLQVITRRASKRLDPPKADVMVLRKLLTKSLTAGLLPLPDNIDDSGNGNVNGHAGQNLKRNTRTSGAAKTSNGGAKHVNGNSAEPADGQGLSALTARPVDFDDALERREKLRSWFHFMPIEEIHAENIREWLAWAFAARELEEAERDPKVKALLDEGLEMLKYRLQLPYVHPGYNRNAKPIRLTLDRVQSMHRPLGYYVVTNGVTLGAINWIRWQYGFRYEQAGKCMYLVKPPVASTGKRDTKGKSLPILFLHGLGIGLGQYVPMLAELGKHKDGVVILLQPHISTGIYSKYFLDPPTKDEQAAATLEILKRHNMKQVTTLSHSNGTMVLGWLLRKQPATFPRNILVDPVSFCLWEGKVCYSFVYKQWQSGIEVLLGYFVGREIGIAHTIARRFIWFDMVLWADELPNQDKDHLHVVFGERDVLVDVPGSVKYLRDAGVPDDCVTVMKGYQHGQALMHHGQGMKTALHHAGVRK